MRKIKYFTKKWNRDSGKYDKKEVGEGVFHAFGVNYQEFEEGPANYSTAIIELPNGEIKNVDVDLVQFIDVL